MSFGRKYCMLFLFYFVLLLLERSLMTVLSYCFICIEFRAKAIF